MELTTRPWYRPRWWELVPEVVLGIGLTYFFVDEMDAATSAFQSVRAVAIMLATGAGWIGARLLLARFVPWAALRLVPFLVATAVILTVVVAPAYRARTVVEQLEAGPIASSSGQPSPAAAPEQAAAAPATPHAIRTSTFRGLDHRARGTVTIYQRADDSFVIGLEEFDIQPGPDYDVYVVPGTDRTNRDRGTRLDDLRGNAGTQYYDVPKGVDLGSGPWTVLVWCQTFGVPVANASPV